MSARQDDAKRIGIAFSKPRGKNQRRDQCGVYDNGTARYEGHRYQAADGEVQVGLPLGGRGAAHTQTPFQFDATHFGEVTYFKAKDTAKAGGVYCTTYCNQGHKLSDGRPVGHDCVRLPVEALRAEAAGDMGKAVEVMTAWRGRRGPW